MNYAKDSKLIGIILWIECILLLIPALIAFFGKEASLKPFLITIFLTFLAGGLLLIPKVKKEKMKIADALFVTSMTWISMSAFGAMPLYLSGAVPTYIDAYFEIMSGFTTTGSTLIADVESLDNSLNFFRCFTHWIGGMGIMIFTIAILPGGGSGAFQVFRAESPGPDPGRLVPKIRDTAIFTYKIYTVITLLCIISLLLSGMNLFDSIIHAFSALGTGGFSNKNTSIAYYNNPVIEYVLSFFMILAATNFSLYYHAIKGGLEDFKKDEEYRLYLKVIIIATLLIAVNLFFQNFGGIEKSFRDALFQVVSLMSTTGFASVDFDKFPTFSKWVLMLVMFFGGSAGSTAGGMKITRISSALKIMWREITYIFHPNAMRPIITNGKADSPSSLWGVIAFLFMYITVFSIGVLLISLEGYDFETTFSSVLCTLSNVGPGFHLVGPTENFSHFSQFSKVIFSILMLLGRLEIYTVIAILVPGRFRK